MRRPAAVPLTSIGERCNKPDATTPCRFRQRLTAAGKWDRLLTQVNSMLMRHGQDHAVADATFLASARRPRKVLAVQRQLGASEHKLKGMAYSLKRALGIWQIREEKCV